MRVKEIYRGHIPTPKKHENVLAKTIKNLPKIRLNTNVKHKKDTDYCKVDENMNKIVNKVTKKVFRVDPYWHRKEEGSGSVGRLRGHVRGLVFMSRPYYLFFEGSLRYRLFSFWLYSVFSGPASGE